MSSNSRVATITSHLKQKGGKQLVRESCMPLEHKGYGKVILFGEHFVVYGVPAVVCAVNEFTDCKIKKLPKGESGWKVTDNRPAVPGYIVNKAAEQKMAHDLVINHLQLDLSQQGIEIVLGGPLVPTSGIGASASNVTALARALSHSFDLNLNNDEVNAAAYVGEGGYHGTPSGIDNTAATFGGLLSFRRTKDGPKFSKITTPAKGFLVVVSTGITASTTTVVGEVRSIRQSCPLMFEHMMTQYQQILDRSTKALAEGDWDTVGRLMNENHLLLKKLGLSIPELEKIIKAATASGAIGAKLSGTGRGGIAVALCSDAASQQHVAEELKKLPAARFVWKYSIGGK
eukprot:TRINITY_DN3091_c0_g1_i3.p1 TRINITY_DN3091_c0_g1~~TRINITY_DN3091_c0_g1_i3.p1  ORF type:complete len:344 (+),score=70.93 TRINITY_DN3091_c0_g1_i3:55-1086(+)